MEAKSKLQVNFIGRLLGIDSICLENTKLIALKKGNIVSITELESKKPGDKGIPAKYFEEIIDKKWNADLPANSFINRNDIV